VRTKTTVWLSIFLVLTLLVSYVAVFGVEIGLYDLHPWASTIPQGMDLAGGMATVYEASAEEELSAAELKSKLTSTISVIRSRLDAKGYPEAVIQPSGNRIRVEIPGAKDESEVLALISSPAKLEFKDDNGLLLMEGKHVKQASAGYKSATEVVVFFTLTDEGRDLFTAATRDNLGKNIHIELDGEVISSPTVKSVISGGEGYIEGNFTRESAENLAISIESGTLPLEMKQIEIRSVSATLGKDVLDDSLFAGLIGLIVVLLIMLVFYRLPGLVSGVTLGVYVILLIFMLATVQGVQLTLPGIAGILLSIGMAVDGNVIVFERFQEEYRAGKNLRAAVDLGFSKAFAAIFDGNITTILAAIVLGIFGTGTVRGFAVTLGLGTIVAMFTTLVVLKYLMRSLVILFPNLPAWLLVGKKREKAKARLSFTKNFKWTAAASVLLLVVGIVGFAVNRGPNMGIDFTGGTLLTIDVGQDFATSDIESALDDAGFTRQAVQVSDGNGSQHLAIVRIKEDVGRPAVEEAVVMPLQPTYADIAVTEMDSVGATISVELQRNALLALAIACGAILLYIWIRFELRSGVVAVIALFYNVILMIAAIVVLQIPINSPFVAAILTIVGYTINNTIIVFDRLRENMSLIGKGHTTREVVDMSISKTMRRTINTTLTTLATISALYIFGGSSIREFALPIIIGLLAGIYSTVFLCGPAWALWVDWSQKRKGKTTNKARA